LTGDARGDSIIAGLEHVGTLRRGGSISLNVLKVPHHGSANNAELDFFKRVKATHYVISGNGEHGNPERAVIEMIFEARRSDPFDIHLTYPIEEIDAARAADWKTAQAREKKNRTRPVRENWSTARHSLAALLKKTKLKTGQSIHIVDPQTPHVIDLLEPLAR
jgi:hypothetical protein